MTTLIVNTTLPLAIAKPKTRRGVRRVSNTSYAVARAARHRWSGGSVQIAYFGGARCICMQRETYRRRNERHLTGLQPAKPSAV